jgi:hypothetical protein
MTDFSFGSCMHTGVGMFWTCKGMSREEAIKTFDPETKYEDSVDIPKTFALKAFTQTWESKNIQGTEKKNLQTGIIALAQYCELYSSDSSSFIPDLIECPQWLEMPNGTILSGIIDRVLTRSDDYYCIVDTKTTGMSLGTWFWVNFGNSFQLGAYDYIVRQILGHNDGIQIDAISVPFKDTEKSFQRQGWVLTDYQRRDWLNTYLHKTNEIQEIKKLPDDEQAGAYCTHGPSCGKYGGCKFLPLCKFGLKHPALKNEFIRRSEVE